MAIAYSSQGSGVATETSGAALSPLCPATVNAGDILIAHVYWEGTTTAPSTPAGWSLLSGPHVIETSIARHWVFGKIADGTEDGAAVAFGSPAVTTQRGARVYSFIGRVSGTIGELCTGFSATSHASDPQMPTVTTLVAGGLAVALVGQNDNNAQASPTGETGGDWTEAVAEFTANLTPGLALGIHTCTPTADPGTVTGGADNTGNDPVGVIGFAIRDVAPAGVDSVTAAEGTVAVALSQAEAGTLTDDAAVQIPPANITDTETASMAEAGVPALADSDTGTLSSGLTLDVAETAPYGGTLAETGFLSQPITDTEAGTLAEGTQAIALGATEEATAAEATVGAATPSAADAGTAAEQAGIGVDPVDAAAVAEDGLVPATLQDADTETLAEATELDQGAGAVTPTDTDALTLADETGSVMAVAVGTSAPPPAQGWPMIGGMPTRRPRTQTAAEREAEEAEERRRRQRAVDELLLTVLADV